MRILFLIRPDWVVKPGGDTVQLRETMRSLSLVGVESDVLVDVTELGNIRVAPSIIHGFNIDRASDLLRLAKAARAKWSQARFVVSTIHHKDSHVRDVLILSPSARDKAIHLVTKIPLLERVLAAAKIIFRKNQGDSLLKRLGKSGYFLFQGDRGAKRELIQFADALIVLANIERQWIEQDYGVNIGGKCFVVPNGVPLPIDLKIEVGSSRDLIQVARIEPRKNQLSLLKAAKKASLSITFVGRINPNFSAYAAHFVKELKAYSQATWIQGVSHAEVQSLLRMHKVHVLPSFAEVLPLVDFEAFQAGCFVLTTDRSGSQEYLPINEEGKAEGWQVFSPILSTGELEALLIKSLGQGRSSEVISRIPSWEIVAAELKKVYFSLMT